MKLSIAVTVEKISLLPLTGYALHAKNCLLEIWDRSLMDLLLLLSSYGGNIILSKD